MVTVGSRVENRTRQGRGNLAAWGLSIEFLGRLLATTVYLDLENGIDSHELGFDFLK
jgi:hypothetical protein